MTLIKSCFIGTIIITSIEFAVGIFVNIIMDWQVWDYSAMPFNLLGQICPQFLLLWLALSLPGLGLCTLLRRFLSAHL